MRVRSPHGAHSWWPRRPHPPRVADLPPVRPVAATVIDGLAVYRLTRLVTEDALTAPLRDWVDQWANRNRDWTGDPGPEPRLSYFLTCPWCVSIWLAAGVVIARRVAPRAWAPVAELLALSAGAGIAASTIHAMRAPAATDQQ